MAPTTAPAAPTENSIGVAVGGVAEAANGSCKKQNGDAQSHGSDMAATAKVFEAIQGHWLSASLGVLLELRVADLLAKESQPIEIAELAKKADVSGSGVDYLYKVLRVLAQHHILDELPGKKFTANSATRQLTRPAGEPSLGHMARHLINKPKWEAWRVLPEGVKAGKTPFALAHDGQDVYQYGERPENGEFAEEFMLSMTYFTRHSLEGGQTTLKDAYDWASVKSLMDVGGGRGELLSRCMHYAGEDAKGLLFDRPFVVKSVDVEGTFEAKGVKDAKERLSFVSGDVREPFPEAVQKANLDTIIMKHFLSAFSDQDCDVILKNCAQVLPASGKLLLLQTLVPEPGDRDHNACEDGVAPGLFAIEILAMCPGGAWRTLTEWKTIFEAAGFTLDTAQAVGCNMHLMIFGKK